MVLRSTPSTVNQACNVPDVSASGRPERNPKGSITRRRRFNNEAKLEEPGITETHRCESGLDETGRRAASKSSAGTQDTIASRCGSVESQNAQQRNHFAAETIEYSSTSPGVTHTIRFAPILARSEIPLGTGRRNDAAAFSIPDTEAIAEILFRGDRQFPIEPRACSGRLAQYTVVAHAPGIQASMK